MFSTHLGHFDALFNNKTARLVSKMPGGPPNQSTVNIYIILTDDMARKFYKKDPRNCLKTSKLFQFHGVFQPNFLAGKLQNCLLKGLLLRVIQLEL